MHHLGETLGLSCDILLFLSREICEKVVLGAHQDWDRGLGSASEICDAKRTSLKPRAWRNHSLILLNVRLRVRSNMNKMALASLLTSGSIETNSRCPPRSQIFEMSDHVFCELRTY